ncbi:NADPH-dependent 7-cyano-7-deazaguanine reductase QueF [Burkholderia stagnalis]|uniref:NADPH-dependent 7-cyano-7-deazaguanine reductase QueF n=1 Tax=Burkholderia stagnalis TaxID=1503054 RepID=UPI000756C3D5|nr:NADPH-dependent 7-cyano-7-deazaguanine reductase QueF [Burkholderia stagnalis]KVO62160.1 NADPH-dependent 7-cyano-7-deazaguanine reductase [Burkholderia stagnalis]KVP15413.1 NADPH-dependent 7-cyano-7-deazaguanine reductase [Burkholderia stagnalis]KVW94085.1 NADPH-dependent 7-cyano-7-deazaguanine reductase [Burkholderia stagnalis]KWH77161.1 NADPH-dependent 7-cyano-7-deazaguanine reductase [Burkholderia stagnalis]KWK24326.1 NADPH-dependent 7-cyano-7-deazaguanine reductase [Burkholderia stagnal
MNTISNQGAMELGKQSKYESIYNPEKLYAIPRTIKREEIGITGALPFFGVDVWNHYELSWLTPRGVPRVAIATIVVPCASANVIESKSMKLYFNTFNNTTFADHAEVERIAARDLSHCAGAPVSVTLEPLERAAALRIGAPAGTSIDDEDIDIGTFSVDRQLLATHDEQVSETLYSNLLKSNCLVTGQPDWGTVEIAYEGRRIDRAALLRYVVSFRNHEEFHEQCVERIFKDIQDQCAPTRLTVAARYTRRGGLDINPVRSSAPVHDAPNTRLVRQ